MKRFGLATTALLLAGSACAQHRTSAGLYSEAGWTHLQLNLRSTGPGLKASADLPRLTIGRNLHPNLAIEGMVAASIRHGRTNGVIAGPPAPPPPAGDPAPSPAPAPAPIPDPPPPPSPPYEGFVPGGQEASSLLAGDLTSDAFGATTDVPFRARMKVRHLVGVFLKPRVQFGPLELFGRVGFAHTRMKTKVRAAGVNRSTIDSDGDFAIGAGLSYQVLPNAYLSLDFTRYYDKDGSKAEGTSLGIGTRW